MPLPKKIPRSRDKPVKDSSKRILANRYQVEKRLGSGNFGTAWLVTDLKCKDPKEIQKVLKEISVGELQPDETVDAMHEANLLRNLDHPGIVKFHDSFMEGEFFCIVTEFCEGGDLDVRIQQCKKTKKRLPEAIVIEWLIQLLLAVQYMHSRRVLHRDLKTRNIFLRNNMIKIGDFGISRILMGTTDMATTFTGTPYYMSPEVLKHEGYNSKSDVWSIGCMLYEMVTLKHAFEGQSLMGVMYKIVEGNLPEWPEGYTEDLHGAFQAILEKDPAKRPSASEVLKLPFIEKQMELLKNTMMDKHLAKEQKDSINRESQQIVMALKQKSNVEQLRKESEEAKWRNMSPRERMRLRKQMKADEEAKRLSAATQKQVILNTKKYERIRQVNNPYESALDDPDREPEELGSRPFTAPIRHRRRRGMDEDDDEDDDDEDEVLHTVPGDFQRHHYSHADTDPLRMQHLQAPQYITVSGDDRPITPMRDTMVYDVTYSSLDFKDGIPDTPDLAETYYSQFEDEFEEVPDGGSDISDEDSDEADGTLLATVVHKDEDNEVGDLINCMQNALDRSDTIKSQTVSDDTVVGAFGPHARHIKIINLRAECEKKLGVQEFEEAYDYLKKARFGEDAGPADEGIIMGDLRQMVQNPNDCFMVDQLLFLEEQARLAPNEEADEDEIEEVLES